MCFSATTNNKLITILTGCLMKNNRFLIFLLAFFMSGNLLAADLPSFKPGLWQLDTVMDGESEGITKQCMDENTSKSIMNSTSKMMGKNCGETVVKKEGGKYTTKIECNIGGSKMVSVSTLSGDFKSNFVSENKTTFTPPLMGEAGDSSVTTGKWLGECEKGMKPGDTIMPDGTKINIHEAMENMPQMDELMDMQNEIQNMMNQIGGQ